MNHDQKSRTQQVRDCFTDWWEGTLDLQCVEFDPTSHVASLQIEFPDYAQEVAADLPGTWFSKAFESPVVRDHVQFEYVLDVQVAVDAQEVELFVSSLNYDGQRLLVDGIQGSVTITTESPSCRVTRRDTGKISERRIYLGGLCSRVALKQPQ